MKKRKLSAFWSGCLATAVTLALGTTVLAASGQVTFNFANVAVDGKTTIAAGTTITAANGQQVPSSILYTDAAGGKTNYLPIRTISELLGVEIGYDSATKTVLLGEQSAENTSGEVYWQRSVDGTSFDYTSERPLTPYTIRRHGVLPGCRTAGGCRSLPAEPVGPRIATAATPGRSPSAVNIPTAVPLELPFGMSRRFKTAGR